MDTNFKKITGQKVNKLLTIDKSFPNDNPKKEYLYLLSVRGINKDFANNLEIDTSISDTIEKVYLIYRLRDDQYHTGFFGLDELDWWYPEKKYLKLNSEVREVNGQPFYVADGNGKIYLNNPGFLVPGLVERFIINKGRLIFQTTSKLQKAPLPELPNRVIAEFNKIIN